MQYPNQFKHIAKQETRSKAKLSTNVPKPKEFLVAGARISKIPAGHDALCPASLDKEGHATYTTPFITSYNSASQKHMRFGNYNQHVYGLLLPRLEGKNGLSMFEQLYLKKYGNHKAIQEALRKNAGKMAAKVADLSDVPSTKNSYPNISYCLFANSHANTPLSFCRPILFDSGRKYYTKSEKERFRKITSELAILRGKMAATPDKSKLLALAVKLHQLLPI